jgi:hypothetical protein
MVVDLEGEFDVELSARIDSVDRRLRATFNSIPDAPVSRFVLNLLGGDRGLLVNSRNLCRETHRATVRMAGQNGMRQNRKVRLRMACGSKSSRQKRNARHSRARANG